MGLPLHILRNPSLISSYFSVNKSSSWASVLLKAVGVLSRDSRWHADLLNVLTEEMESLNKQLNAWTGNNPLLDRITEPYRRSNTQFFHPLLVLLMSRASRIEGDTSQQMFQRYKQLSRVTELIHAANLIHINIREDQSTEELKLATLVGDYLLGKASVDLSHLESSAVTELMASVIANLVEGHFMKPKSHANSQSERMLLLQSAFLPAKACLSASILNNASAYMNKACFTYGRYLGLSMHVAHEDLSESIEDKTKKKELLNGYRKNAKDALTVFPDVEAKQALREIAERISIA
ncbi:decaprenyl diphosphate synthase subunit 2 Dlp1 [Schizosaccharomyces cryophilus OY26]|uniref:Decaprenyl diphosphate synthase subunit 2 Dlp1 n=1 Tax=Schizosaccharomyces cryophilus (strain OY26 / ATCC MYA-4695 / CBS 11777 / NBRC 106824 / NRRL Y48691) TaxID=653667 RepID=S9VUJ3_SCHCR|nr:decaprenyl diphosphate synthase subunit 2 Dlp1 [Schizosaccharomyces cryophilus OY26]EPY51458.1 decaprenyl diphosphate synthase subunit 2 Dlp1 [Schizosaccharomyces cryophilus OY26]